MFVATQHLEISFFSGLFGVLDQRFHMSGGCLVRPLRFTVGLPDDRFHM